MIELAIERFDLKGYVIDHGGQEAQVQEWILTCPTCGKDKLVVNLKRRAWHCWVCQRYVVIQTPTGPKRRPEAGAGGLLDLIQLMDHCDRKRAVQMVLAAGITSRDLSQLTMAEFMAMEVGSDAALTPIHPPPNWRPITVQLPYMAKRGITMDDAQRLGMFWVEGGRYSNRLVFPVWDEGRLVYWQARAMWEPRPGEEYVKALNPPRIPGAAVSSEVLMNLHYARAYPRVVVTEGPVDAIHAGPDAVCSFGKSLSPVQLHRLWRAGVRALDLMYDADARADMEALAPLLASLFDTRLVYLPHGDPGGWPREALVQLRQYAVPVRPRSLIRSV
jgi:hypothetical protein